LKVVLNTLTQQYVYVLTYNTDIACED